MLQKLRSGVKSPFASVFIGVLALSFAVWGVSDIFRGGFSTAIAEVGDTQIDQSLFSREYQNALRRESRELGAQLTNEDARQLGIPDMIVSRMVNRVALDNRVKVLGLTASDAAVAREIRAMPQFLGPVGTFEPLTFERALQQIGYGEAEFLEVIRGDIARQQFADAATAGIVPPPGLAKVLFDYVNETRTVEYIVIGTEQAGTIGEPDDAALQAYVEAHPERYSSPEYRTIAFATIGPAEVASEITVTDADVEEEYRQHGERFNQPERRDIEQISFANEQDARAAAAEIAAGKSFIEIAQTRGFKPEDLPLGTLAKADLDPARAEAAFATAEGGVSEPVRGPFGWVLLRTTKITPGIEKSFAEVRDTIREELVRERAADRVIDLLNAFDDELASGATLHEAASRLGLPVRTVAAVSREGLTPGGVRADIPDDPQFLEEVFNTEVGDDRDPFETTDAQYYALRVDGVTPPAVKPLAEVRAMARDAWIREERLKRIEAQAKELAERATAEGSFAGVARVLGRAPLTSEPLRRFMSTDTLSPQLVADLFASPQGEVIYGPVERLGTYVLARVVSVSHPDPATVAANYDATKRQIGFEIANDITASLAAAAREVEGVEINRQLLDRLTGAGS